MLLFFLFFSSCKWRRCITLANRNNNQNHTPTHNHTAPNTAPTNVHVSRTDISLSLRARPRHMPSRRKKACPRTHVRFTQSDLSTTKHTFAPHPRYPFRLQKYMPPLAVVIRRARLCYRWVSYSLVTCGWGVHMFGVFRW